MVTSSEGEKGKALVQWLIKSFFFVFVCYALGLLSLYLLQEKLIFFPQHISQERMQYIGHMPNVEKINLQMKDGTGLSGWIMHNNKAGLIKPIIYFGGNADELSYMLDFVKSLEDRSIVLINYRGYGLSQGSPSEQGLCNDALEIYDYVASRQDVDKSNIVVMGRSLGTGVATFVAAERDVAAVILVSPYDSLENIAQEKFPVVPVRILLKNKFDSLSRAPAIKKPLLILTAADDILIRPWRSQQLAKKWGGEVSLQELKKVDHDSICRSGELWESVDCFLKTH